MKNFSQTEKCKQAAIAYLVIGIAYTITGSVGMPPHDYGALIKGLFESQLPSIASFLGPDFPYATALWTILISLGTLFLGLSYFIYKGYKSVLYVLTAIYLLRLIFVGRAVILDFMEITDHSGMMYIIFPMIAVVFFLLLRATFNLKP